MWFLALVEILNNQLVPGDIICLSKLTGSQIIPCDILLIKGTCVVNESILTGESAAQVKYELQPAVNGETGVPGQTIDLSGSLKSEKQESVLYDPDDPAFSFNTLYAGTELLQARCDKGKQTGEHSNLVLGLVIRTGRF